MCRLSVEGFSWKFISRTRQTFRKNVSFRHERTVITDTLNEERSMLLIINMWYIFYSQAFVDFITQVKIGGSCCTDGPTATSLAGVSINPLYRVHKRPAIGDLVPSITIDGSTILLAIHYQWHRYVYVDKKFVTCQIHISFLSGLVR